MTRLKQVHILINKLIIITLLFNPHPGILLLMKETQRQRETLIGRLPYTPQPGTAPSPCGAWDSAPTDQAAGPGLSRFILYDKFKLVGYEQLFLCGIFWIEFIHLIFLDKKKKNVG